MLKKLIQCFFVRIVRPGFTGTQQQSGGSGKVGGLISYPATSMATPDWMVSSLDQSDSSGAASAPATVQQTLMLQKQLMQQQQEQQQQQQFLLEKLLQTEQQYHQQQQLLERLLQDDETQGQLMQQVTLDKIDCKILSNTL
jgi:hypothetical protein